MAEKPRPFRPSRADYPWKHQGAQKVWKPKRRSSTWVRSGAIAVAAGIGAVVTQYTITHDLPPSLQFLKAAVTPGCNIKGNISLNSGQRIYHLPGQTYYGETRISLDKGERWFCSEAEARAAGWRKSKI